MLAIRRAIRRIHTTVDAPRLTRFALHPPKSVRVTAFSLSLSLSLSRSSSALVLIHNTLYISLS